MCPIHHQITLFKSLLFFLLSFLVGYKLFHGRYSPLHSHFPSEVRQIWSLVCVFIFYFLYSKRPYNWCLEAMCVYFFPGFCEVGIQTLCREPRDHEQCESRSKARLSSHPEIQMKRDLLLNSPKFLVDLDSISEKSVLSGIKNSRWFVFTFKASNRKSKSGFFTRQSVI